MQSFEAQDEAQVTQTLQAQTQSSADVIKTLAVDIGGQWHQGAGD